MTLRPVASGRRRPPGALLLTSALLSCGAAALTWGAPTPAAVVRQQPEEKLFSTGPQARFRALLYVPKAPETGRSAATPVIFYSGEWGWRPLQQDVASYIASTGRFVLGIDSADYFANLVPAAVLGADLEKFRAFVNERAGRPRNADVILIGFALGAEMIPYLLNETRPPGVKGAVLIAPGAKGAKVYRVSVQLKMDSPPDEQFDVGEELKGMAPLPVALMEGTLDKDSAAKALADAPRGPHKYVPVEGGDRQFHDVRDGFFAVLLDALHWIDGATAPKATPPSVP